MYELRTQYDSRKSFYGKALVYYDHDVIILRSYSTNVAMVKDGKLIINGWYSATTTRHIKDFAYQYGFYVGSVKEMTKLYCV